MSGDPAQTLTLRQTLASFASHILNSDDPREGVSVSVERQAGFQNLATTARELTVLIDEPEHFGGMGQAPDPAELMLAAAGASLSVTLTAHAALQDIRLESISMSLSAKIDGRSFFHPGTGDGGLLDVEILLRVTSPDGQDCIEALLADVLKATPVIATFRQLPTVSLTVSKG